MISKAIIKDIQNLALKKHRDEQGRFMAEGLKWVDELLHAAPGQIQTLYATAEWIEAQGPSLHGQSVVEVEAGILSRISQLQTPNQVVAVVKQFEQRPAPAGSGISLVLDTIQDPGNLGTLIRTADWFGIRQILCSPNCADIYNPKVVQATMGSLVRVPVSYLFLPEWVGAQTGISKWAAVLSGTNYAEIPADGNGILMMGNESRGLSDALLALATDRVTIPRRGGAESLNVAVATGILLARLAG
jgi:TrmH family RNA methyltransferase